MLNYFEKFTDDQLLNMCSHAFEAACYHHAKHDAAYENSLGLLMEIVEELMRRSKNKV